MSWSKQITIWCDGADCGEWDQLTFTTVAKANKEVKCKGWKVTKTYHFCPKCAENQETRRS